MGTGIMSDYDLVKKVEHLVEKISRVDVIVKDNHYGMIMRKCAPITNHASVKYYSEDKVRVKFHIHNKTIQSHY